MLSINGVRPAVPLDAASIAGVQIRAWQAGGLTPDVLTAVGARSVEVDWATAVAAPPSPRHRVLVAVADGVVVGFAATAPADDPDSEPSHEGELVALHVDPSHRVAGHGSRLLSASVDGLRDEGCDLASHWVAAADRVTLGFLEGAGWAVDGARRELDLHGDRVTTLAQVRLHTALGTAPDTREGR